MNTPSNLDSAYLLLCFAWTVEGRKPTSAGYAPAGITQNTPQPKLPWLVVRSALWQLLPNLLLLRNTNDSEAVHQARIGWRRLRSTLRLLRKLDGLPTPPATAALKPLIARLCVARDVDVARLEVLPCLQRICQQTSQPLSDEWPRLMATLEGEARRHNKALQVFLKGRTAGRTLWKLVLWLEQLEHLDSNVIFSVAADKGSRYWVHHRLNRLHTRFKKARSRASDRQSEHRSRILAKQLRYATEDFVALKRHKYQKWHEEAMQYQSYIGLQRDIETTIALAEQLGATRVASLLHETMQANKKAARS
jgi:CHAD domain-containing protein